MRSRSFLAALALFGLATGPVSAQAELQATLEPRFATVGDRIEVVLTLPASSVRGGEPRFPTWGKRWGEAEIVEAQAVRKETTSEGTVYRQRISLTSFAVGAVALPPVPVAVPDGTGTRTLITPAGLGFEVRSVLPPPAGKDGKEKEPEAKPAVAPLPLPLGRAFWWTLSALALACALVLWIDRRRRKNRKGSEAGTKPLLAPFDELVQALAGLDPAAALEAHTRISHALRRYLSRRLPFPALESTTSEIQRQLASRRMPAVVTGRTVELLRACDLVKFARREAGDSETLRRQEVARALAAEFERHFAPPAPAPREAA